MPLLDRLRVGHRREREVFEAEQGKGLETERRTAPASRRLRSTIARDAGSSHHH